MESRPSWDMVWMQVAQALAPRSKCSRAQVGAVLVDAHQNVLSCSYNGPPPSWPTPTDSCKDWCTRAQSQPAPGESYDACPSNHAEANGVARADSQRLSGATCYVTSACCMSCAKLLASAGVGRVVHVVGPTETHRQPDIVERFLRECGVHVDRIEHQAQSSDKVTS